MNLNQDRFYEITEIPKDNPWCEEPGHRYCALGAIIQPTKEPQRFKIIVKSPTGYLTVSGEDGEGLFLGDDMTLRPLNKKDQAKLQLKRDQFCA